LSNVSIGKNIVHVQIDLFAITRY